MQLCSVNVCVYVYVSLSLSLSLSLSVCVSRLDDAEVYCQRLQENYGADKEEVHTCC